MFFDPVNEAVKVIANGTVRTPLPGELAAPPVPESVH
jgi:hypothetical protein